MSLATWYLAPAVGSPLQPTFARALRGMQEYATVGGEVQVLKQL